MNTDNLTINYSLAMLGLYHDNKKVFYDFMLIKEIFETNLDLLNLLSSDSLTKQERIKIVDNIFGTKIYSFDDLAINLIKILIENRHIDNFLKILNKFKDLVDRENNVISVEIHSAFEIEKKQLDEIVNYLIKKLNSKIDYKILIDSTLIGGFKVVYDSNVIDFSIKGKIEHIKHASKEKSIL